MGVHTHSLVFMCTQWVFRGYSHSLIGIHEHSVGVQGVFNTHSLAFTCTHKPSEHVQYWLKGAHVYSRAIMGYSILTKRHSCALTSVQGVFSSDINEIFLMVTPWWVTFNNDTRCSCTLNGWSNSLKGVHAHSMGVQGVFILTYWRSCTLNGCSGAVPTHSLALMRTQWVFRGWSHSLIGVHVHS
jgi:hypothetical protein